MTDTFRKDYKPLDPVQQSKIVAIKVAADVLLQEYSSALINMSVGGREMALAKTKLEESVMWAIKAIT